MNSEQNIKHNIENILKTFDEYPLREASTKLLNVLGYHSNRTGNDSADNVRFERLVTAALETTNPDKLNIDDWQDFNVIFQVGDEEIRRAENPNQRGLFDSTQDINDRNNRSYMFVSVSLSGEHYTRSQLADITRFINKDFQKSIMVMFRYSDLLTLSVINRRPDERQTTIPTSQRRQVLEKVTLLKDIKLGLLPKRAHTEILADLHLHRLIENERVRNFDTLHDVWERVLDMEPLTREFYSKLHKWYERAVDECTFADNDNELQVIRLITRLIFIWFLKEKKLIPPRLFDEEYAQACLNDFDIETSDYYQAVLQNLFFATLNTPINDRGFGTETNTYHYEDLLDNPDGFIEHLKEVPFVNGGLFDCHITQECFTDDINERQNLYVPAKLFFEAKEGIFDIFDHYKFTVEERTPIEQEVALDPELLGQVFENLLGVYNPETKQIASKRKNTGSYYTPHHIVEYMVNESLTAYFLQKVTPYDNDKKDLEDRIREDLLVYEHEGYEGKVSDHLIHNDEIEPLIQAIDELKMCDPAVGSGAFPMNVLNKLVFILQKLDPQNERWKRQQLKQAKQIPDPESMKRSVDAIKQAFSAENYHNNYSRKLYLIQNCIYGVDIQPFAITIARLRFFISLIIEQDDANSTTEDNYGIRPLPNLEAKLVAANTLIGLNFLQDNKQLDLLQEGNTENEILPLLRPLWEHRSSIFFVDTPQGKVQHIEKENQLCAELTNVLERKKQEWRERANRKIDEQLAELPTETARQQRRIILERKYAKQEKVFLQGLAEAERVRSWKAYDPNTDAGFFEPTSMFGVTDGFDIAIGNPPYIRHEKIKHLKNDLEIQFGDFFTSTADISVYFYKRAAGLIRDNGILTYICTNKFLRSDYGEHLRQFLTKYMSLQILLDLGNVPIFKAAVDTCITLINKTIPADNHSLRALTLKKSEEDIIIRDAFQKHSFPIELTDLSADVWAIAPQDTQTLLKKIKNTGIRLDVCVSDRIYMGIKTGCNDAFIIDTDTREQLISEDVSSEELIKPLLRGKNLCKWKAKSPDEHLIVIESSKNKEWEWSEMDETDAECTFMETYPAIYNHLIAYRDRLLTRQDTGRFYWELRSCAYYTEFYEPKIVYGGLANHFKGFYETTETLSVNSTYFIPTRDLSLLAILNSKLFDWYSRYKFQTLNDPWDGGGLSYFTQYMEIFPIADRTDEQKAELSQLVEQILADPDSENVPALEKDIDEIVYQLYDLSDTEIALIKQTYKDAGMKV